MNTSDTLRTVSGTQLTLTEHKQLTQYPPATEELHPATVFYPLFCMFQTADALTFFYPSFISREVFPDHPISNNFYLHS